MKTTTGITTAALAGVCALFAGWAMGQDTPQPAGPETVKLISSIDGPTLYRTYCAVCHGNSGKGGGPMAESLKVPPSDLTHIAARNGGEFPLARVEKIITGDQELTGGHGTRSMPIWGPIFSQIAWDQDLGRLRTRNLATYLQHIQAK
jgi:mono/diheme cytochrome c family protein